MQLQFFEDKQIITSNQIPTLIYEKLLLMGGLEDINGTRGKISFCGIIITEKSTYCFLPTASKSEKETDNIQSMISLVKVINSYKLAVNSSLLIHDEDAKDKVIEEISLINIIEILDLFFNGGILRSKNLTHSEKGRINWSKTINQNLPVITTSNIPVYMDLDKHPISIYQDDIISSIHSEIILDLFKKFFWLDNRFEFLSAHQLSNKIIPIELSIDQKINLLRQRLYATFISLEIQTLSLLINYLEKIKNNGTDDIVIGIRKFHYVWEFLLKNIFTDIDHKINSVLPIPQYHYTNLEKSPYDSAEKGMRIDLFIKKEDRCWIIDSKYYLAINPQTAPGWSDLVKQFFYVKAIRLMYPEIQNNNIKNIFIFPGRNNILSKIQMTYRQNNQKEERLQQLSEGFFPIDCLYLDPPQVMEHFLNGHQLSIEDFC